MSWYDLLIRQYVSLNIIVLHQAKAEFCDFYDDDESFGAATFNEILRDIMSLQKVLGQNSAYTLPALESLRLAD